MKKYLLAAGLALLATTALAESYTTAIQKTDNNLTVASGGTLTVASGGTLTAASGSTVSLAGTQTFTSTLTRTMAPSADSATTNKGIVTNLTSPVDTTGTNTHNAFDVGLTIGNATGGTNSVRGFNLGNVTGDAQVDVTGFNIGTGTRLGTSNAIVISTGWDKGIDITNTAAADSAATEMGIDINLTTPVDTTGTNTHYGLNIDYSIGNATGGTNTATGINIANVTGDAQVNVTGLKIGTGTTLGTSNAIDVGSGWDLALNLASAVLNTAAPAADSAATNYASKIAFTTPVDTTGTNTHYAVQITPTIGNATGGTNVFNGIQLDNITGDAQVTETAISVGTGYDSGLTVNSPASFNGDVTGDGGDQMVGFLRNQVASTTTSATIAQCGSTFVSDSADVITLPEASTALGCRYTFVCGTADDFDVNPADGTDQIGSVSTTNGTTAVVTLAPAAGDAIRCTDIGGSITLEAVGANLWVQVEGGNGVWTDVN